MGATMRGALVVLLSASAAAAEASTLDLFGVGGRSPAMAATGVATSDGFDSIYLNPAGLAEIERKRLTFGALYGDLSLALDGADTGSDPPAGFTLGGALPLPLGGALRDRVGLGIGLFVPSGTLNRARHPLPGEPVFALLESRSQVVSVQLGAGVALGERWRVGAGVLALAELRGGIHVSSDPSGRFTTVSQQRLAARFAPLVGARRLLPERNLSLGFAFRGASRSDYDIVVTNDLQDDLPLTIPTIRIAGASQYDPLTVAFEAAWRPRAPLLLVGQLAYQRWSAYPLPTINPVEGGAPLPPPDFRDTVVPRVALEWTVAADVAARAGYAFLLSPAPEMDGPQSLLDNHRHLVSAGLGVARRDAVVPLHLDVWVQLHALMPRRHTKDPSRFEPGAELPFQSIETSGRAVVGGLTLGVDL